MPTINIDEEDVNLVFGIPRGTKEMDENNKQTVKTKEHMAFIKEIKEKYPKFPPSVTSVQKRLIESQDEGRLL